MIYHIKILTDKRAPIVPAADVTFIGDLFEVVPMLTKKGA
jgi:electron transfer flavoprotein alpha subunit